MTLRNLIFCVLTLTLAGGVHAVEPGSLAEAKRIVAVGGAVTETIHALGFGDRLVGVDTSSTYPEALVSELPKVGYARQLAAEGIVSLKPDVIVLTEDAGPPPTIAQLEGTEIPMVTVPHEKSVEAAQERITFLARAFGAEEKGEELVASINADIAKAKELRPETAPKVLFIYARGAKMVMASGTGTEADAMIRLAGGENAVTSYADFRPISAEGVVQANPDVILMMSKGAQSLGDEGVWNLPGIKATTAGQEKNLIVMDDLYLLGFGPRTGQAVLELTTHLAEQAKE